MLQRVRDKVVWDNWCVDKFHQKKVQRDLLHSFNWGGGGGGTNNPHPPSETIEDPLQSSKIISSPPSADRRR